MRPGQRATSFQFHAGGLYKKIEIQNPNGFMARMYSCWHHVIKPQQEKSLKFNFKKKL
jgi:hypothetical protein